MCGHDETISHITSRYLHLITTVRQKLGLPLNAQIFQITMKDADGSDLTYLVPAPVATGLSPTGRNTCGFSAYDTKGDCVVFLKDTWCVLLPDIIPEGDVYKHLNEKHVRHIATCLASGDVLGGSNAHTTQTGCFKDVSWARPTGAILIAHVHYRLVLNIVTTPITSFVSSHQYVILSILGRWPSHLILSLAHQDAYEDCNILHCDLSVGNIMVHENEGILIDWDLAKLTRDSGPKQITRTGTWQFMSACLVANMNTSHDFQDNMESMLYVILWIMFIFTVSCISDAQ
ncbi:uncharacterized protein F5891DRAFT_944948 [Suillus fuscotomentosus]|uniref:Fungal-type protein kinase domain-containing protein n=1 Tax=Suillus fuscotomentosus TaxID=1912939 RepID=A0AAD4EES1_9AGAM|nr:uncharacterized protein F5891DRAFT_944948 [Suillus fuscotomentosus]KAG1904821.1 hypothetical protein F5891DRAFT_944948 [Suillus fuscotomentosus]